MSKYLLGAVGVLAVGLIGVNAHTYTVRAYDAAGNASADSNTVTIVLTGNGGGNNTGGSGKCSPWPSCRNN